MAGNSQVIGELQYRFEEQRGRLYEACVRSALLYGAETWTLMSRLVDHPRMLRYMAGVRWQDGRSSSEVLEMCGVEDFSVYLRQKEAEKIEIVWTCEKGRGGGWCVE